MVDVALAPHRAWFVAHRGEAPSDTRYVVAPSGLMGYHPETLRIHIFGMPNWNRGDCDMLEYLKLRGAELVLH